MASNVTEKVPYWERKNIWCRFELHTWGEAESDFVGYTSLGQFASDIDWREKTTFECTKCGATKIIIGERLPL